MWWKLYIGYIYYFLKLIKLHLSQLTTLRGCILEDAVPSRLSSSRGIPIKEVLETAVPEVQLSCLRQATAGQSTCEQLLKLDEQGVGTVLPIE